MTEDTTDSESRNNPDLHKGKVSAQVQEGETPSLQDIAGLRDFGLRAEVVKAAIGISLFICPAVIALVMFLAVTGSSLITPNVIVSLIAASVVQWGLLVRAMAQSVFPKPKRSLRDVVIGKSH